jgi:uncharacterized protein with HEPN domain
MRPDRERLQDIIESCEAISLYQQEIDSYHGLLQSRKDQDALLYELAKIGEACTHVSGTIQNENPHIAWAGIKNLRNIIIHEYFGVDLEIVWEVVTIRIPQLSEEIKEILNNLKDDDGI